MKYLRMFRRTGFVVFSLILVCAAFVTLRAKRSSAIEADQRAANKQLVIAMTRDGLGSEVQFAAPNASSTTVTTSVNTVANFIHSRSGITLSTATKNRLAAMESATLNGTRRRITPGELSDIMTTTAFERLSSLSDEQLAYMAKSLNGFDAPDLPESFRNNLIHIRASRVVGTTREEFVDQLRAVKEQIGTVTGKAFQSMARETIQGEVQNRVKTFSEAVPEQFGGTWDVANDMPGTTGLTPLRAVLLTYSVAADDALYDSETHLRQRMITDQQNISRLMGVNYPSPEGHFAFGANGWIYSTPLDLVFDEQTINRLLNHIEERSSLRAG